MAPGPSRRRAVSQPMSFWPRWTPSAPTARATSTRSLMSRGIFRGARISFRRRGGFDEILSVGGLFPELHPRGAAADRLGHRGINTPAAAEFAVGDQIKAFHGAGFLSVCR